MTLTDPNKLETMHPTGNTDDYHPRSAPNRISDALPGADDDRRDLTLVALTEIESVLSVADETTSLAILPEGELEATCGHLGVALRWERGGYAFRSIMLLDGQWRPVGEYEGCADDGESIRGIVAERLGL